MNKIFHILVILCLANCMISCDIPGKIVIVNRSDGDAAFKLTLKDENDSTSDISVIFNDSTKLNEFTILFGFGQLWTKERVEDYVSDLKMIEVYSVNDSITITNKQEMMAFFIKRRGGMFKDRIKVKIY